MVAGACGSKKEDTNTSSTETVKLSGDSAAALQVKEGTPATVVENPADAPNAAVATATPVEPSAKEELVDSLATDTGLEIDVSTLPDLQWVTVKSADGKLSMDVPSSWTYTEYGNGLGNRTFGALDGDAYSFTQYVVHGLQTSTLDESVTATTAAAIRDDPTCKPAPIRPYEDERFVGSGRSLECTSGLNVVTYAIQGKGDISSYNGYFAFRLSNATGVAAMKRAILSLEVN